MHPFNSIQTLTRWKISDHRLRKCLELLPFVRFNLRLSATVGQTSSKLHQCTCWSSRHAFPEVGDFVFVAHHASNVQMSPVRSCDKLPEESSCCARTPSSTRKKEQPNASGTSKPSFTFLFVLFQFFQNQTTTLYSTF